MARAMRTNSDDQLMLNAVLIRCQIHRKEPSAADDDLKLTQAGALTAA
jgi:hypothetical protein